MDLDRRSFLAFAAAASVGGCAAGRQAGLLSGSTAEDFVTLIVPATANSRTGIAGAILAKSLQRELTRRVEILHVQQPGQGYELLASAAPDGRTFGLIAADLTLLHRRGLTVVRPRSVTPLALVNLDPAGIHVRKDSRWRNAKSLVRRLRDDPGQLRASGSGWRAIWHVAAQRWALANGFETRSLAWKPMPGPAAAAQGLVEGGPDIVVCSVPEIRMTRYASGIRTLAVMAARRSQRYPEIAALEEFGPGVQAGQWRGVAGPDGMSDAVAAAMTATLRRVHDSDAYKAEMFGSGFGLTWADQPRFAAFIDNEDRAVNLALSTIDPLSPEGIPIPPRKERAPPPA